MVLPVQKQGMRINSSDVFNAVVILLKILFCIDRLFCAAEVE